MAADNEKSKQVFVFEIKMFVKKINGFENLIDIILYQWKSKTQQHAAQYLKDKHKDPQIEQLMTNVGINSYIDPINFFLTKCLIIKLSSKYNKMLSR